MPFEELIAWSNQKARPEWQKDALRRLAITGELTDDDLSELRSIVEKDATLIDDSLFEVIPLVVEHLSDPAADAPRTILGEIGPVRGIDRLASDQPAIKFASKGITLVYGANASGKTGYCRIAKQLCRSISPQELKGNVYEDSCDDPPAVDLVFAVEGDTPERSKITWRYGEPSPPELARISVFDTASARVYVDKNHELKFLPYELDLLNKLALAAKTLEAIFEGQKTEIDAAIRIPLPVGYNNGTKISQVLEKLVSETVFVNLPDEKYLRSLAQWNDEKETALQSLTDEIRDDPKVRLRMHKLARQELENIKTELSDHLALLGDEAIIKIKDTYTEMTTKAVMARVAVEGFGKSIPIFDIGSESWRQMLLYARQFAGEAFPERGDPKLVTAESCVLCQQSLDDEAAARMAEFDDYISGCAASDSREARLKYEGLVASTNALKLRTSDQVKTSLSVYAAMDGACQIVAEEIAQAYGVLGSRLDAVKMMIEAEVFWESDSMEAIPNDLVDKIDASLTEFQEQIVVLGNVDKFEERFKVLTSKKAEFEDERKLSQNIETVVARLNQLVKRFKILDARKQCSSGPIAKQLTARRRVLFTNSLETQLRAELTKLELSHISINLLDRSVGANSVIEVDLAANNRFASKSDVLSDGEQRALALSCFLAELIEVGAKHGIIIDDPVSSLDHSRMEAVAKRLVEEAKAGRQVIIFTHNIIFHYMMENEARRSLVPLHSEWMSSLGGTKFGIIGDSGKPPHTKKVKQRINDLSKKTTELFNDNYDCTLKKFRDPLTAIYTEMRETWERIVEEILFNGTIQRFRSEVMTKSLQYACYNPADDYPAIYEGMKRCSLYSGHDKAVDWSQYLPTEEDIKSDLKELIDFYEKVSSRKKKLEDGHNYEKVPKPEFL